MLGVGDDRHRVGDGALLTVERRYSLAGPRASDDHLRSAELIQIEYVRRLAELVQHIIRRVDDIVDRP